MAEDLRLSDYLAIHSLQNQRKWERDCELCRKIIIENLCLFTTEGEYVPIFDWNKKYSQLSSMYVVA